MHKIVVLGLWQNHLDLYKQNHESHFRVHFYLRNVYYSSQKRLQSFLEETSYRISQIVPIHIIQIYGSIQKYVDLSVGIKNDELACLFFESNKYFYLPGQGKTINEHQPFFSQAFKIFFNSRKQERQVPFQREEEQRVPELIRAQSQMSNLSQIKQIQLELQLSKYEESLSKKMEGEPTQYFHLYVFGVPLQYKEKDIAHVLNYHKVKVKFADWKMRQDVEYLLVQLYEGMTQTEIQTLQVYIERYPLLVSHKAKEETISDIIYRHQIELHFEKNIDQIQLMKFSNKIGGVFHIVKDQYYGPKRYIVVYSTTLKLRRFNEEVEQKYKGLKLCQPKCPIRICRLEKSFSFGHTMDHLVNYERELERVQAAPQNYGFL